MREFNSYYLLVIRSKHALKGFQQVIKQSNWEKKAGKEEEATHWEVHGPKFSSKLAVELEGHLRGNTHHSIGLLQRSCKNALAGDCNQ